MIIRPTHWILKGKEPVPEHDLVVWGEFFADSDKRRVARTEIAAGIYVSTVFLGLDHSFSEEGPPILFETMVFNDYGDVDGPYMFGRYATWDEAEKGHEKAVEALQALLDGKGVVEAGKSISEALAYS